MRRIAVIWAIAASLVLAPHANASTPLQPTAGATRAPALDLYQSWVDASLVPTPPTPLTVALRHCDRRSAACLVPTRDGRRWVMRFPDVRYLAAYGEEALLEAEVLFDHEMGHHFVAEMRRAAMLRDRDERVRLLSYRQRFARIFGYELAVPFDGDIEEHFADEYGYCAVFGDEVPGRAWSWGYGFETTPAQHRRTCGLIRVAARGVGWA
jgi:hypothetical protein